MSFADYSHKAEDHQSFLILIRQTGKQLDGKTFNRVWDRIRKLQCLKVPGNDRKIWLRYKRSYPVPNNEWGDFQAHRKVLGLLSVGHCKTQSEFEVLFKSYVKLKEEYSNTIFNSRLIVFGLNRDGTPLQETDQINGTNKASPVSESESVDGNSSPAKFTLGEVSPSSSFGSEDNIPACIQKQNDKKGSEDVKVPLAKAESSDSLSLEKSGSSVNVLVANGENNGPKTAQNKTKPSANSVPQKGEGDKSKGNETTSRPHSNSLSKDSSGAEVVFYPNSDSCEDLEERLQEFASSLFFVLDSKRLDRSFERSDKMQLLCTPFEKKDYIGVDPDTRSFKRRCQGRLRKHLADLSLQAGLPGEAIMHYQTALDMLKSVNDWLWIGACHEGLSSASVILAYPQMEVSPFKRNFSFSTKRAISLHDAKHRTSVSSGSSSFPNGVDFGTETKSGVNSDDIIDKYKEALTFYSKYKQAGIIEMEASLKACRVLISLQKFLAAADFLQNVVYISVPSAEEDKVQKYSALATLYTQIGFHRKASFFKRIAAMQCVAPQVEKPLWHLCHKLLLQAMDGYNISLDPKEFLAGSGCSGWPLLQLRVLNELGYSARKMGNPQLIVRHEAFLLHTMHDHLTAAERRQATTTLESFTSTGEVTNQPLALENGTILQPVPLTRLPSVRCFKPMALPAHLHPVKLVPKTPVMEVKSESPFIYSPFVQSANNNNNTTTSLITGKIMTDFQWVVGDVCEISLQVYNPLSDELKVSHMSLLTDGVEFETFPASPTLSAESGPCLVKLMGTPKTSGELSILGYTTIVFGVRSICRLKDIPNLENTSFEIEVSPPLPQLQLVTSLPKAASFFSAPEGANIVTSATTTLFAGQSEECSITLQNIGSLPVETVEINLEDKYNTGILESVFSWNKENIVSQLPLEPGAVACLTLYLHGTSDFISNQSTDEELMLSPVRSFWGLKNVRSNTVTSQDGSSSDNVCLETLLRVKYSGGEGLVCGYCRHSSVALSVDIQPALAFSKWDVLPADSPDLCYLVLDGRNETSHIMNVTYDKDMTISIEGNQVKRFAVLLRRIDFSSTPLAGSSKLSDSNHGNKTSSSQSVDQDYSKYSSVISSYVDIHWTIPMLNSSGKASLEHLTWLPRQLELIQAPPLQWDVRLNSSCYEASGVCVSTGELVSVQVLVSSKTDIPGLSDCLLSIDCYQDNGDSNHTYTMSEKVVVVGTNKVPLSEVCCDNSYKHDCDFIFLAQGKYYFEIKCSFSSLQTVDDVKNLSNLNKWTLLPAPQVVVGTDNLDFIADETDFNSVLGVQGEKSGSRSSEDTESDVMEPVQFLTGETIHTDKVLCNEENFQSLAPEVAT